MTSSQLEQLQERVGERLGIVLTIVGAVLLIVGLAFFLEFYISYQSDLDWGIQEARGTFYDNFLVFSLGPLIIGGVCLPYGAWRYLKFRRSPVYPRYVASRRQHKIARIEAKRLGQVQPMQNASGQQPQPLFKEREVVLTEVVMIKCSYCGTLNPQTAQKCSSCGARM